MALYNASLRAVSALYGSDVWRLILLPDLRRENHFQVDHLCPLAIPRSLDTRLPPYRPLYPERGAWVSGLTVTRWGGIPECATVGSPSRLAGPGRRGLLPPHDAGFIKHINGRVAVH